MEIKMLPSRPYLLKAFYNWIIDSQCTPHVVVSATAPGVEVPEQHIDNGKIVLNVSPMATRDLDINHDNINFRARFSGVERKIFAPIEAVMAVYAVENGRGIVFEEEDFADGVPPIGKAPNKNVKGKPNLRIVD